MAQIGREKRAWLVFTTPMDPSGVDPRKARSAEARRHMRSNGGLLDCVQMTAVESVYTHVYVLLSDGTAYSISLDESVPRERHWTGDRVRQTRRLDQMDSGGSFKVYRRITDVAKEVDRLAEVCRATMAKARYPRLAYWTTMLLGRVLDIATIARYTAGPHDMTCSVFAFTALRDGLFLVAEEAEVPPVEFYIPDNLMSLSTVSDMLEDTPGDVADFIDEEYRVGVSATSRRMPAPTEARPMRGNERGVDVTNLVTGTFMPQYNL